LEDGSRRSYRDERMESCPESREANRAQSNERVLESGQGEVADTSARYSRRLPQQQGTRMQKLGRSGMKLVLEVSYNGQLPRRYTAGRWKASVPSDLRPRQEKLKLSDPLQLWASVASVRTLAKEVGPTGDPWKCQAMREGPNFGTKKSVTRYTCPGEDFWHRDCCSGLHTAALHCARSLASNRGAKAGLANGSGVRSSVSRYDVIVPVRQQPQNWPKK
jgi:hypothetical protein